MIDNIIDKIAKGVAYNAISRILIVAIQAVTSVALARILSSSDYGIFAFAGIFMSFFSQFSDFGLSSALIQRKNLEKSAINTAFTIRNLAALVIVLLAIIISFIVPIFYEYPNIAWIIRLLALNFILNSFGFISATLLKRDLNFVGLNLATLISTITGSCISVYLAYNGYGYWSLVIASIISTLVHTSLICLLKPCKLKYELNVNEYYKLWNYGGSLFISGIMAYVIFNGGNFIVGSVQGASALGIFSIALDWGTKIPTVLSVTVISVLFPAFSRIIDDVKMLTDTYIGTLQYVSFISILANITLICVAEDFLVSILGGGTDKWIQATNCLRILCLYGIVRSVLEPVGSVVMALGETRVLLKAVTVAAAVQSVLLYPVLLLFDVEGVALLILASYSMQYPIYFKFLERRIGISPISFFRAVSKPLMCSVTFAVLYLVIEASIINKSSALTVLKMIIYAVVYIVAYGYVTKFKFLNDFRLRTRNIPCAK